MNILHISTNYKPVGSGVGYGGVERLVGWLSDQQREDGHTVLVATVEASDHPGALAIFPAGIHELKTRDRRAYDMAMSQAFASLLQRVPGMAIDVVHDHMGVFVEYAAGRALKVGPLVVSVYAQPRHYAYVDVIQGVAGARSHLPWLIVTASSLAHQRQLAPVVAADFVVHTAVPEAELVAAEGGVAPLCLAGVRPDKQQLELASYAANEEVPFIFAGPILCPDAEHAEYGRRFLETVRCRIDLEGMEAAEAAGSLREAVRRYGVVHVEEIFRPSIREVVFGAAERLVLLNSSEEVFSLVVLEALARGLTVVSGPFASALRIAAGVRLRRWGSFAGGDRSRPPGAAVGSACGSRLLPIAVLNAGICGPLDECLQGGALPVVALQ